MLRSFNGGVGKQVLHKGSIKGLGNLGSVKSKNLGENGLELVDIAGNIDIINDTPSSAKAVNCNCCGMLLVHDSYKLDGSKFKCAICGTTNVLAGIPEPTKSIDPITYKRVKDMVTAASKSAGPDVSYHDIFKPLSSFLYHAFRDINVVNNSFKIKENSKRAHYSTSNIDFADVVKLFNLLTKLPTKRPLYQALRGCVELSKRVYAYTDYDDPTNLRWLLIIFQIPMLNQSLLLVVGENSEVNTLCFEILKRSIGTLSNSYTAKSNSYLASWFSKLSTDMFTSNVNLLNHFLTFHLKSKYSPNSKNQSVDTYQDYVKPDNVKQKKVNAAKISIHQYGNDWHIKSAANYLALYVKGNTIRKDILPVTSFYNTLVDFVDLKLDFNSWQKSFKKTNFLDCLHQNDKRVIHERCSFFFCHYPFLISLGGKIAITEYEARRQMERKAEEAFINSLDTRVMINVYFLMPIHRDNIIADSLANIKSNRDNFKKTLRVKFIGEPGIDAGGLKKEWFLILSRKLISSEEMFVNCEDSNLLWFSKKDKEMYYLFGAVLGLAIHNSTILDLQFPRAIFKILLGKSVSLEDYQQLYPVAYENLMKLQEMSEEELKGMDLTFEASDGCGTHELIEGGVNVSVDKTNLKKYVDKYYHYFMFDGIKPQVTALKNGFLDVVGGNGLSLYSPEEIELLLCGDNSAIDFSTLKSITKYYGWLTTEQAKSSQIVRWFWEVVSGMPPLESKKLLAFVTGSDRVPATGIQNLSFRISLLGGDSKRLPSAHTCFNELELYNYDSFEKLASKLTCAVDNSAGFGMK